MLVRALGAGRLVAAWRRHDLGHPGRGLRLAHADAALDHRSAVAVAPGALRADAAKTTRHGLGLAHRSLGADRPAEMSGDRRPAAGGLAPTRPCPDAHQR